MKTLTVLILLCMLFSFCVFAVPVRAQEPLNLTITSSGTVVPSTGLLEQNGTTYTFRGDIYGTINVQKSGITIDGAGFTLQGQGSMGSQRGINLVNQEAQTYYRSVTIQNLRLYNYAEGLYCVGSGNIRILGNYFDAARIHVIGKSNSSGNLIEHNIFSVSEVFYDYGAGVGDEVKENNFFNSHIFVSIANAPYANRNHWSNYTAKYPNASEAAGGIWDTPYVDEVYGGTNRAIDYQPLVNPLSGSTFSLFSNPPPTSTPLTSTATPTSAPDSSLTVTVLAAAVVVFGVALFAVWLVLKRKRRLTV